MTVAGRALAKGLKSWSCRLSKKRPSTVERKGAARQIDNAKPRLDAGLLENGQTGFAQLGRQQGEPNALAGFLFGTAENQGE